MRYTLSVLTAACLLALGQPVWSESLDREWLQRVRTAALALPATDRANAALLLYELQASVPTATRQRHLPLNRCLVAAQQMLQQEYGSVLQAHQLPQLLVAAHWLKPSPVDVNHHPAMDLDTAMVARWANAIVGV